MSESIHYREMIAADTQVVSDLVARTFNTFVAPDFEPVGVTTFLEFVTPGAIQNRLEAGAFGLVAHGDKTIAGVIEFRDYSHITLLFVDAFYQRRGISRTLVQQGIAICQQHNPQLKEITVNSSPYAVAIYQHLGFVIRAPEETHSGIRAVPMRLELE